MVYEVTRAIMRMGCGALADRRGVSGSREACCLSRWVRTELLARTETLQYDRRLARGGLVADGMGSGFVCSRDAPPGGGASAYFTSAVFRAVLYLSI
jgi:hypothetical protein